ncbi:MAG: CBS domain-containing protein [Chlorobiales bacterium]|nr:CBS domain-containing protein [Chlorobiales bacterium]
MMSFVQKYIEPDYPVFQVSETARDALVQLHEQGLREAPVMKEGKLLAVVSIDDLRLALDEEGADETGLRLEHMALENPEQVCPDEHILDIYEKLSNTSPDILAVTSGSGGYEGVITKSGILEQIGFLYHFSEQGATLELEAPALGVKVSEIISVIEKNDAMVLSFGITEPDPGAQSMVMTFRIQCQDIYRLVTNLEKYGYLIRYARSSEGGGVDELREKALEFMRYIDM